MVLGREDREQQDLLDYPKSVSGRHLCIKLTADGVVFKDLSSEHGTCISPLPSKSCLARIVDWRMGDLPMGPRDEEKLSRDEVVREFTQAGWKLTTESFLLEYQYVLIFAP